jgi:hypothetical protein
MKSKPRFTSEQQILEAIDRAEKRAMAWALRAEALDKAVAMVRRTGKAPDGFDYMEAEEQAAKLWSMQRTTKDKALPLLKRKLAEFRTTTMPFLDDSILRR